MMTGIERAENYIRASVNISNVRHWKRNIRGNAEHVRFVVADSDTGTMAIRNLIRMAILDTEGKATRR